MHRIKVESSNIASIGYDAGILEIEFKSGRIYQYFNVPEYVYDDLLNGGLGNVGRYFQTAVIKAGYDYKEIKDEDNGEPDPVAA